MVQTTGPLLLQVSRRLVPDMISLFEWGSLWNRPLDEGVAFEWTTTAALIAEAAKMGWSFSFPLADRQGLGWAFPLRNEVPHHNSAQPGHSGRPRAEMPLRDLFLQSLIPKAVLSKSEKTALIFREGCAYHKLLTQKHYEDRPDILFVDAAIPSGFPQVCFPYVDYQINYTAAELAFGRLRIMNSLSLPIVSRRPTIPVQLQVLGVVECSVSKSIKVASEQVARYSGIFQTSHVALVTGNGLEIPACCNCKINLNSDDVALLEEQFRLAAQSILTAFGFRN